MINLVRMNDYNYTSLRRSETDFAPKKPSVQAKNDHIYLDLIEFLANIVIHNVSDLRGLATGKKDFEEVKSANVCTVSKTTE